MSSPIFVLPILLTRGIWNCRRHDRWQIQLTSKPWPLSKIVAQKHSVCSAVHPSKLLFDKQALDAWLEMFQLEFSAQLSLQNSEKTFFCICTTFPTLGGSHLASSRFVWRGLSNDITNWVRSCQHCQQGRIHRHTRLLPQPISIP
jgi:hypothetical protein